MKTEIILVRGKRLEIPVGRNPENHQLYIAHLKAWSPSRRINFETLEGVASEGEAYRRGQESYN